MTESNAVNPYAACTRPVNQTTPSLQPVSFFQAPKAKEGGWKDRLALVPTEMSRARERTINKPKNHTPTKLLSQGRIFSLRQLTTLMRVKTKTTPMYTTKLSQPLLAPSHSGLNMVFMPSRNSVIKATCDAV